MIRFIDFGGSLINPAEVYKIDRVVETVTFTLLVGGLPAGSLQMDDFVFADEATAIAALDDFVADSKALTLEEAICCVTSGVLANSTITVGALKNTNLGEIEARVSVLISAIIDASEELVLQYEAL